MQDDDEQRSILTDNGVEAGLQAAQDSVSIVQHQLDAALALCTLLIASECAARSGESTKGVIQQRTELGSPAPVHRWAQYLDTDESAQANEDSHDEHALVDLGEPCCRSAPNQGPDTKGQVDGTCDDVDNDSDTCQTANDTIDTCAGSPVLVTAGDESMKLGTIGLTSNEVCIDATDREKLLHERAVAERMLRDLEAEASSAPVPVIGGV